MHYLDALMNTGSAFSMLSSALYDRIFSRPAIQQSKNSAMDIVNVGGASYDVKKYVDISLLIVGVEIVHPLLVVSELSFLIIIGIDIMQLHAATLSI